jgi:trimeric autotransporter adhesin
MPAWLIAAALTQAIVTTVAGNGPPPTGDGNRATDAALQFPFWVTPAPDGTIVIVDYQDHRIRRIKADGTIETVAGVGAAEGQPLGDDGPARDAVLRFPRAATFGPDGTMFIADTNHYAIRAISPDGRIRRIAGNRSPTYAGDGGRALDASFAAPMFVLSDRAGVLYVADQQANRVRRISTDGVIQTIAGTGSASTSGDGGPAVQAAVNSPSHLAFDSDQRHLYVSTRDALRRIDLATSTIASVTQVLGGGFGICGDGRNNLYIASNTRVQRLDLNTMGLATIAGTGPAGFSGDGGPASQAQFNDARGACADGAGSVYVADGANQRVRRITVAGTIETAAGGVTFERLEGDAAEVTINDTQGVAVDHAGNVYFTDFNRHYIRRLDRAGRVTTVAGNGRQASSGDGGHPKSAAFSNGLNLIFDGRGNLLFLDLTQGPALVRSISPGADGVVDGSADERIVRIAGQVASRDLADHGAADGGPATRAVFNAARGLSLDAAGNLYVADAFDHTIRKVVPGADGVLNGSADETITTIAGSRRGETAGDGGPARDASLWTPVSLVIDASDNLFVVQGDGDRRIRRIDGRTGVISSFANAAAGVTQHLMIDRSGNLYWGDNRRLFRATPAGAVSVVAGSDASGYSGDGGNAIGAAFRGIQFGAFDPGTGDLYLVDNGNFRLRRISWR